MSVPTVVLCQLCLCLRAHALVCVFACVCICVQINGLWKAEGYRLLSVHVRVCCENRALASVQQPKEIYPDIKITPCLSLTHKLQPEEQTDVTWTQSLKSPRGNMGNGISDKSHETKTKKRGSSRSKTMKGKLSRELIFWDNHISVENILESRPSALLRKTKKKNMTDVPGWSQASNHGQATLISPASLLQWAIKCKCATVIPTCSSILPITDERNPLIDST